MIGTAESAGHRRLPAVSVITVFLLIATSLGFGQRRSAATNNRLALSQPLTVRWRYDSNLTLNLTPAFDAERIYLPLAGGMIVSLKAADGQLYWRSEIGGELSASPVADDGAVYVAAEIGALANSTASARRATGTLQALGREAGVTQWMRTLAFPLGGSLTVSGNKLIAGGNDGRVYAFDKKTGGILWSVDHGARFNCQPLVIDGRVYVGSEDGTLLAIDEATGRVLWRYRTNGPVRGSVVAANGTVFFGSGDGYVYALQSLDGHLSWRKRTGESLLVASLDNFVYLFSLNGARIWKRQLLGRISSQPLTAEDGALFTPLSSLAGVVLGLRDGRPINSLPTGEEITTLASPIAVLDAIFLTTEHGLLAFAQPQ